jgi:hypothetical protein
MSPDPYDGSYDPNNPQSLNRYSYALNNPLVFSDPSGLNPCSGGDKPTAVRGHDEGDGTEGCDAGGVSTDPSGTVAPTTDKPVATAPTIYVNVGLQTNCPAIYCQLLIPSDLGAISRQIRYSLFAPSNSFSAAGTKPTSKWEKAGMYAGCIAGMDPDFATPLQGDLPSNPVTDPLNSTAGTTGQRNVYGPNNKKTSGSGVTPYNPSGNNSLTPDAAAGGSSYIANLIKCIENVNKTYP